MDIVTVVGARPQFVKAAVVSRALRSSSSAMRERIVHTGQHYDDNMSSVFFREMGIPSPDVNLGVAGGPHGQMTGRMLEAIEVVLSDLRPDWVLLYGDTNSTLAGALAASKLHVPVAHVEAGLRSFNRRMPEELNRVLTDHLSSLLFAPTVASVRNLAAEGIYGPCVQQVGDVMHDAFLHFRAEAERLSSVFERLDLRSGGFVLASIHRAENTDDPQRLSGILQGLNDIARRMPVVFPMHPRTRAVIESSGEFGALLAGLRVIPPVGYLDMVKLEAGAALIATDSGGVQKEAFFAGVPCLTLRDETEWVELVECGANVLVGACPDRIADEADVRLGRPVSREPLYGDGSAAVIIARALHDFGSDGRDRPSFKGA